MVTGVVADLLQAAEDREIGDRVGEDDLSGQCQPGGDSRHILLGHPDIDELIGETLGEIDYHPEAEIADQKHDPAVFFRQFGEFIDEGRSH